MFKRSLLNRIHGWFPQDAKPIAACIPVKVQVETKPPQMIPPYYTKSYTQNSALITANWLLLMALPLYECLSLEKHPLGWFQIVAIVAVSITLGASIGILVTKRQLEKLVRTYELDFSDRFFALIGMAVVFLAAVTFISITFQVVLLTQVGYTLFFFGGASFLVCRYATLAAFEKKQQMRLMTSGFGDFALIPKAPNSS